MCGIFGYYSVGQSVGTIEKNKKLIEKLFLLSESRGRDAAGIAMQTSSEIRVLKRYLTASEFIQTKDYAEVFNEEEFSKAQYVKVLGHARLATNGMTFKELNNQPVVTEDLVGVHNGIITNDEDLWKSHQDLKRNLEVDTEFMLKLFTKNASEENCYSRGVVKSFKEFEGNVSCGIISPSFRDMILATNNGSVYYTVQDQMVMFASEKLILNSISDEFFDGKLEIKHLLPNFVLTISEEGQKLVTTLTSMEQAPKSVNISSGQFRIYDLTDKAEKTRAKLRRCTRCVLPETFPFISFDQDGVCNICKRYTKNVVQGTEKAHAKLAELRKNEGDKCLLMLSGGRDSCYGLHHAVKELGLKPIAYTYDWGMVTDIARRNAERMCGKLGVEHIIVSADIRLKRKNINKNISAWLNNPQLGMVPIFMAGDKQFLYYGKKIRDINNLPYTIISTCPFEKTGFKTGFAGVDEGKSFIYNIPLSSKAKFFGYYSKQFLTNPSYLNSSIFDSVHGFWSAFLIKHDFFQTFDYEYWEEKKVVSTLVNDYNWELDPEAGTSWRIGDGTAAFYNLIYYTMAGFTENDTFRSNQIREGVLDRQTALQLVERENQPRWKSLEWYASVIGFNLAEAVRIINHADKLYLK